MGKNAEKGSEKDTLPRGKENYRQPRREIDHSQARRGRTLGRKGQSGSREALLSLDWLRPFCGCYAVICPGGVEYQMEDGDKSSE